MKRFQILLYSISIIIAVGIGMGQVGKARNVEGSQTELPPCGANVQSAACGIVGTPCSGDYYNYVHNAAGTTTNAKSASSDSSKPRQCVFSNKTCGTTAPHLSVDWSACKQVTIQ